jgi:hypothetical protein
MYKTSHRIRVQIWICIKWKKSDPDQNHGDPQITGFTESKLVLERLNPLLQTRGDKWDGPSCTEFYIHSNQHEARKYYYHAQYLKMD